MRASGNTTGSTQGSGVAWLGSTAGQVVSWGDTQVVAAVASTVVAGVARIEQNGAWSNALAFTVPADNAVTLMPSVLNMMVGDTHPIQALSAAGQPVTGLTWTSSDTTIVSLSSDDPPVLTAVAAGHVTITAGTASADVTVLSPTDFPAGPPLGTVLWSHPGDVDWITPAVPSPTGVADVFAFENDGNTVEAITSDGITAWTADVSQAAYRLPDFQGGLVTLNSWPDGSLVRFDGMTGQPLTLYTSPDPYNVGIGSIAVHPDGTVFALEGHGLGGPANILGFDSTTGAQKFNVPVPYPNCEGIPASDTGAGEGCIGAGPIIIAGDGYAYVPFQFWDSGGGFSANSHLHVLQVSSSGEFADIPVRDWTYYSPDNMPADFEVGGLITNADTGILLSWWDDQSRMAIINGGGAGVVDAPDLGDGQPVIPMLQAQDGSFVGTQGDLGSDGYMVAFDAGGGVRWSVPSYYPQMATADGGVIASPVGSDSVSATAFDQNGSATGQMANTPTLSWPGNTYQSAYGSGSVDRVPTAAPGFFAVTWWPFLMAWSAHFPVDAIANSQAGNILTDTMWSKFAGSHCATVFQQGFTPVMPSYSLQMVQEKGRITNFYDVGNPGIANLEVRVVTGGRFGSNQTLIDYLAGGDHPNAHAVTVYMGFSNQTAIVLKAHILSQPHPEFLLVHEVLLHAYAAWTDANVFGYYSDQGLWREADSGASSNITTWISTDCTCTPGKPGTSCQPNTARW